MEILKDMKTLFHLVKPVRGHSLKERLESFYQGQASHYDEFRKRLLPGRESLFQEIDWTRVKTWCDLGAGTGQNLEFVPGPYRGQLTRVDLVDLSPSLLKVAEKRVQELGYETRAHCVECDVIDFRCDEEGSSGYDLVTFSYSLTMIPDWFLALENARKLMNPNGAQLAVVDFFVPRKYDSGGAWWQRSFWPIWFSFDNVFLSPDHLPYLESLFTNFKSQTSSHKVPYLGLPVPYYRFIGSNS